MPSHSAAIFLNSNPPGGGPTVPAVGAASPHRLRTLACLPSRPRSAASVLSLDQSNLWAGLIFNKSALCFSVLIKI